MKDPKNRIYGKNALFGTGTILNLPPSPDTTMADVLDFQVLRTNREVRAVLSAEAGPFCYPYQAPSARCGPRRSRIRIWLGKRNFLRVCALYTGERVSLTCKLPPILRKMQVHVSKI